MKKYKKVINGLIWRRKLLKTQKGEIFWHYFIQIEREYESNKQKTN